MIIGAITDPALEGIMRVSIVATALDGQQPESKSVINMVHRIQNRNPGYSDVAAIQKNEILKSNGANFLTSTSGANALQVENEEIKSMESELLNSMVDENMAVNNLALEETKNEISNSKIAEQETPLSLNETVESTQNDESNGLENFDLSNESPQLFNSDNEIMNENTNESLEKEIEEDELEIPAFLRRKKN